jgi:hypothetical protein
MNQGPPVFWSVPATDLLEQLGATPRGLTSAATHTPRLQSPDAQATNGRAGAPAGSIQEPTDPDSLVCRRAVRLSPRSGRRLDHPGDRPGERLARILAGAGRGPRAREAARDRANERRSASGRRRARDTGRRDRAGRRGRPLTGGQSAWRLPDPGVPGPVRRRSDTDG